jgi:hypothetical protein
MRNALQAGLDATLRPMLAHSSDNAGLPDRLEARLLLRIL